jgi:hypothetical protein
MPSFASSLCNDPSAASAAPSAPAISCRPDLVVVGGTPAGIACAVRAAREGLSVLLVNWNDHLGGILSSGLAVWDTQWEGNRSPVYDEVRAAILDYYRTTYGPDSTAYRDALPSQTGHLIGRYEPRVAEKILTELVAREHGITVLRSHVPVGVVREEDLLRSVVLRPTPGGAEVAVDAPIFADCTYEGDLAALAKVPYRIGREAAAEFAEPHAGIIFMRPVSQPPTPEAARLATLHDQLRLRRFSGWQVRLHQSTGEADAAVQACNYRTLLTTDPAKRVPIPKPAHYAPYYFRSLEIFAGIESIPNEKYGWNRPQLVGRQTAYIEADWTARQRILDEHWDVTMGLLYFLQHDATVPAIVRRAWLEFGLSRDEFPDHGHRPYEIYIREARRICGRATYTQHDAMLAPGRQRAPCHADSVAMTEWYMDSHSCTTARVPDGLEEGKMMLHQETFPGQLPYRCLLPRGVDNLLVPVCLSATHVAWNTVRLEPVFMQVGEAAGLAAALALQSKTTPAALDSDRLVRALCERRSMVAFFNDVDVRGDGEWIPAAQYFGTKGFFGTYDVRPHEVLTSATAKAWADGFKALLRGQLDPNSLGTEVLHAESSDGPPISAADFRALLPVEVKLPDASTALLTRAQALIWLWAALP